MSDWNFNLLESLIQDRGDQVIHERGVSCTCQASDVYGSSILLENRLATRRKLGCEQCGESGWFYRDARLITGLVTGIESGRGRQLLELGYAVPGDSLFSPSLEAGEISDFDKITFLHPAPVSGGQVILRNSANLEENKMLSLGLEAHQDRLWYNAECVYWCEGEDGRVYQQGTDFTVCERVINWIGAKPPDGKFYTVKYNAFLEWIVYATPMTRIDQDRTLGQRVVLRKVHVAAQNDYEFDTPAKRKTKEDSFTTKI